MATRAQNMGTICILFGIIVIMVRVFMWVFTDRFMPLEWGGRFLVGTGAALFGVCGLSEFLDKRRK